LNKYYTTLNIIVTKKIKLLHKLICFVLLPQKESGTNFNITFSFSGITSIDRLENVIGILVFSQGSTENLDRISTKANFISISAKRFPIEKI